MNLTACQYLLELSRARSIRQAADRLRIAPSAISRQITRLEQEIGAALIHRHADGIRLTQAGEVMVAHLSAVFDRLEQMQGDLADLQGSRTGQVSIATVEGITRPFLSDQIAAFQASHPAVRFRIRIRSRDRVFEALEQHICQIGFVYDHFSHPAVKAQAHWRQPLLAFAPLGHTLLAARGLTLADLAAHPFVLPDDSFGLSRLVMRGFERAGVKATPLVVANQLQFLITHALRAGAIVFMPLRAVWCEVQAGLLRPLDLICPEFQHRNAVATGRERAVHDR